MVRRLVTCFAFAMLAACTGVIGDGEPGAKKPGGRPDPTIQSDHTALGARRLTKFEYGNTVRDLLGVPDADAQLPGGTKVDFLSNNAHGQQVGLTDLEAFGRAAESASAASLDSISMPGGCAVDNLDAACFATFEADFLVHAFRRPATSAELARYQSLFATLLPLHGPRESLRAVIESVLMAPSFLYRSEVGDGKTLTQYEIANRLSYLLWATMPDDALFANAAAGELKSPDDLRAAIGRMLADPKAEVGVVRFTSEWLGFDQVQVSKKGADILGNLPPNLQSELEEETHRFVVDALLGETHSVQTLLTANYTFADETVASIYGIEASGASFNRVDLDGTQRRGILTQPLLIAAHSKESGYSAVQMGRFVRERLLCQVVTPPPPGVSTTLDSASDPALSFRNRLEEHASDPTCAGCHSFLDPPGFAYLPYDPIGRYKATDPVGNAFDTTGTLTELDGTSVSFTDLSSMVDDLSASDAVTACFTRRFVEYAFGRTLAQDDLALYHSLADGLHGSHGDFAALLAALVVAPGFAQPGPQQ